MIWHIGTLERQKCAKRGGGLGLSGWPLSVTLETSLTKATKTRYITTGRIGHKPLFGDRVGMSADPSLEVSGGATAIPKHSVKL